MAADRRGERVQRVPRDEDFEQFFRANFPRAVTIARRITGDVGTAEDAAIEAMAKAHLRWPVLRNDQRRASWVLKVATNEAIDRLPRPAIPHSTDPTDDLSEQVALRQTLAAALHRLPKRQREVLVLRFLVGMSEPEVASTLQLSLGTVKTHLRRGLEKLRLAVGPTFKEDLRAQPV
jgi:RNA polymerase sigma factor (sigma-70 family)